MHDRRAYQVTPHVGVWIETLGLTVQQVPPAVTPHVGVWIETRIPCTLHTRCQTVTPHVGVWIETLFITSIVK